MKNIKIILVLALLSQISYSQIKVIPGGAVAIGIGYPNYPLHVHGWAQLFSWGGGELKFRADNGGQAEIGTSGTGVINFWNGNCWANGGWNILKAKTIFLVSDQRLKQNIEVLSGGLNYIKQLVPKQYNFIDSVVTPQSSKLNYGFMAQDIIQVLPDIVDTTHGTYAIDYTALIPFLVKAVQEQALTIDSLRGVAQPTNARTSSTPQGSEVGDLKKQISELNEKISYFENNCCANLNLINSNDKIGSEMPSNGPIDNISLQNIPNPFENTTTVKFNIPSKYNGKFYIRIYKISGEELLTYNIKKEDKEVQIDGSNLVNGVYNYALIANQEILMMKQMIISR